MATWTLDLSKVTQGHREKASLAARYIAHSLFSKVVVRSPVDTGRFRANWQVDTGQIPTGFQQELYDGSASQRHVEKALQWETAQPIYLANNLPYAVPLEDGHSKQAPQGMVKLSIIEVVNEIDAHARRAKESK